MIELRASAGDDGNQRRHRCGLAQERGDRVTTGEDVVEVDADKVTTAIESPVNGVVSKILVAVDEEIEVQGVLALIEETA